MADKKKNNSGQSTIEFIMTFTTAVGFIFVFLKMAMNYTDGYMVHHATYMAARSYLVVDEERDSLAEGDQRALAKAKTVFTTYLPEQLIGGVTADMLNENSPDPGITKYSAFVGLWLTFSQKFSLGVVGGREMVNFTSEAFLGREPTRSESRGQICEAIKSLGLSSCNTHVTHDDNGG